MSAGCSDESLKKSFLCECTNFAFVAGDTVRLEFAWPGPAPKGGQFFLVKPNRTKVFLGRPISVAGWKQRKQIISEKHTVSAQTFDRRSTIDRRQKHDPHIKVDRRLSWDRRLGSEGTLRFLVTRRGQGSRDLVDIRPGEEAELIGPLGNSWPMTDISTEKFAGSVALVGGGIGIAPLLALAPELGKIPYDFYAGFRTGSFGLEHVKPKALIVATEDGSQGVKGLIPDFFTPSGYSRVFACGPEPMLKVVGDACIAAGVPCFVSVERHMACGVGACLGCVVRTTGGNRRCCTDGPIFNVEEILF
jgi:NAD(P)H-flavin reductase